MTLRAAVLASGRGSNFEVLAAHAAARGAQAPWRVALLVSDRADAPVLERARALSVPSAVVPVPGRDPDELAADTLARLEEAGADLVLLAGYLRLVPAAVVRAFHGRMLNIHPALLPAFGGKGMYGARVHRAVLEAGSRITGPTVHFVDERYDRGRILAQWPVPVLPGDTAEELAARVREVEHRIFPAAVDELVRALGEGCDARPIPAPPRAARYFGLFGAPPEPAGGALGPVGDEARRPPPPESFESSDPDPPR